MSSTTILDKSFKNWGRKTVRRVSKLKIIKFSMIIVLNHIGYHIKIYVERKGKLSNDSRKTAKNIYTVNPCTIPSITRCKTRRNNNIVSDTLFSGYSHTFILKPVKVINRKPLMITLSNNVIIQILILVHNN